MASHRNTVTSVYDPTGKKKKKKKKEPTKSHRAEERREGAKKARENPVNKARTGAASYIVHDKVGSVASKPTKVISSTLKNSQDRAGMGRGRRSGAIQPTKNNGKLTSKQEERKKQSAENENKRNAQIAKNREDHRKNGYAYGNNAIKKLDETSKKIDKSFENKKKADLEYGASGLSDKKKDIPIYTKYVKGKAVNEAKTALDESGVTVKKARSATAEQIAKQEAEWKSAGYDVKDDTVVTEDGKTWGELKRSAYEEAENNVKKARKDYINKATKDAGKLSAQDIYKGGVEMASEMLDYAVPYAGTAKASIGVVKSATKAAKAAKAAKAVSKGAKKVSTGDAIKGVEKLLKDGKITPEVAKRLNRRIKLKALGKNVSTELAANALQDATIGTALDLGKGIGQGLEGKELGKYMRDNAIANIAMGAPMSAVAGRAGARETRDAIANNVAKQVNDLTNLTKPEAIKLGGLMKKQERGAITEAEEQTLRALQDKALGNGTAVVDSKGKIEANKSEYALDDLDKSEIAEYYKLKVQDTRGSLDPRDRGRFEALQSKVQTAYKRSEINANDAINIKGKNIKSEDQGRMESAVKFFERTGDEAKLKQAQKSLELAKKATEKKNESLQNAIDTMTEKTGISYRFVDDAEMRNLVGGEIGEDEFAKGFYRVDKDGNAQVIINKESPQAHQTVIGHETAHLIKSNDEKAFNELGDLLKTYATEKGEFDALESQMKRAYPELGKDDFDEEVVSELLGRYVFGEDDKFIKRLADEQPTVLQRIAEYIRNFIAKTNNKELVEQLTKIQNKADEVIRGMKTTDSEPRVTESKASKEKITPESITDSSGKITREADWDYGQAVKNGDMETAQKMVDAALESKGFTYDAYHGSDSFGFTEFDFGKLDDNISIFASNSTETAGTYTKNPNVREVSDATMAREIDEDAINDLEDILWYSNNEPFKDAFDDWRADIDNGLEDARLEDYIEDAMDGAESMFGYMGKDDVIPDETIIEIQRLARKIDSSIKEDGGIYHGKVKMENPLVVEANGSNWQSIEEWMFKKSDKSIEARQKLDELDSEYDDYVWGVLTKDEEVKERLRSIAQKIQDEKPVKASSIKEYNDAYDAAVKEKYESGELIPKYKFADSGKSSVAKSQSEVARWLDDSEKKGFTDYTTREVAEYANENGHDGVIFKNLYDTGRYGTGLEDASDVYVVFDSNQFKSADPVTRDNNGDIIPLSERGNEKSPDFRFSKEKRGEIGEETIAGRAEDLRGTAQEIRGDAERTAQSEVRGGTRGNATVSTAGVGRDVLTEDVRKALAKHNVKVGRVVDNSDKPESFIKQLQKNAKSQKFGVAVDTDLKPEDLSGAKLYTASMGNVTIGVKPDGDIFGLAKNTASNDPHAFHDAMYAAIANGGLKMDAYGRALANKYAQFGFEPVAKIPFNPAYISDEAMPAFDAMRANGIEPDVYVFKHNGDSLDEIARKQNDGEYKEWSQSDLDKLPVYEDYDEAMKYRDGLIDDVKKPKQEEPPKQEKAEPWELSDETRTKIKNTQTTVDNESRRLEIVEKKLNGKIGKKKRGELESEKKDLEERIQRHKDQIRELNKPVYEHRIEVAEGKIKELEDKLKGASEEEKVHINNQIRGHRATITRNTNAMNGVERSDNVVSDTPVSALSDSELRKEYNVLGFVYRRGKTPEHQDLRLARMDELRAEAESRGLDIRKRQERIDELIKNKGVGYEEATKLNDEIKALREKVKAQNKKAKAGGKDAEKNYAQLSKLKKELVAKNRRMTQVLKNSKTTVKEGESFSEAFANKVGGNSLKVNKQSKYDVMKENYSDDKGLLHGAFTSVRRLGENSFVAFENEAKRLIKAGDEFGHEMLAQVNNATVAKNIVSSWVQVARSSADGTKLGKSLDDVFKVEIDGKEVDLLKAENAKLRNEFSNYLYCRHAIDRERQGKTVFGNYDADGNPLWTSADARGYMDEIEKDYPAVKQFAKEIDDYIKDLNQYRLDTGLISKELLDKMNDIYPNYVPTHRVSVKGKEPVYELPRTVAQIDNVIKQATGSDKAIEDLYKQLAKITSETIRSGEQNKLVEMYAKSKGFEMKDIPEGATADEVMEASIVPVSDSDGKWRLSFFKDGKRVEIPIDKQAAKGLREWNGQDFKSLMEFSAKTQKLMRGYKGLITDWNLVFGVRNGMRDAQQALVNSKDSRWFAKSAPLALHAIAHEDNAFRKLYDARGGRWSTLQQISRLDDITNLNKGKGAIAKGLEKIEDINGFIEMNPRMSEFIGTLSKEADRLLEKKGGIAKLRESCKDNDEFAEKVVNLIQKENPKIIATAMRNASDITVNFARSGVIGKALNAGFVPYLNPSIQGLSKMARMFSESKTAGMKTLFGFMAKLSLLTTTPAVMNEVLCQGNEAYQSLNTRDKDGNFFIPMSLFGGDKDTFIKIPKPRENAVLAEPAEYAARYIVDSAQYGTKDEFAQMFKSAQDNVGVVNIWQDNIFAPIFNTAFNRTWYGGKILSKPELENIENGEAWKNYDETTSLFGRVMGKRFNISPKKVDNIMDSYLGMIYDLGISQTSQRAQNDTFSSWGNFAKHNPVVQQFMKDSVYSNKLATKFWDEAGRLNKGKEGERNTLEYNEFCAKYANDSYTYDDAINALEFDKSIPKDKKYEIKRELRKKKNELMRSALDGDDIKDPMQQIINVYKKAGIKNATDKCLSEYSYGSYKEAYEHLKSTKEYRNASPKEKRELQGMYLKTYKGIKKISRQTGDTSIDYTTATYVCVKNGYTGGVLANAFCTKAKEYSVEKMMSRAQNYIDAGYDDKHFVKTFRAINRGAYKLNDEDKQFAGQLDDYDRAMILAQNKMDDGSYYIASGYLEERKNAARCLTDGHSNKDFKWTDKRVNNFCKEYNLKCDPKTYEWDEEQVKDAIDKKYPNKTTEEKAALFVVITGLDHNPYGEIGDYSLDGDSGISDGGSGNGKGGRGRRGRRGGRGGGGGGSKSGGTPPKTASGAFKGKATSPFSTSNGTKKSNLDDAYRKKALKLREANRRILS